MRKYIVETKDGEWRIRTVSPLSEALGLAPHVKNGFVTLWGKTYAVDPKKFRRLPYKPKRYLWLITEYAQVQIWAENDPAPKDFLSIDGPPDIRTASLISTAMNETWIEKALRRQGMDWLTIVLILSMIGNLILGGAVFLNGR